MLRLVSTKETPPGEFQFRQVETGWSTKKPTFREAVAAVLWHRKEVGRFSTNWNEVELEVEAFNALRLMQIPGCERFTRVDYSAISGKQIIVRRTGAIGDVIAASCVADKLVEEGYSVIWQAADHIHPVVRRIPSITAVTAPTIPPHIDLDGAYENDPRRREKHFGQMFLERANEFLQSKGVRFPIANFAPTLRRGGKPNGELIIGVCPRSETHVNRTVPDKYWRLVARLLPGKKMWFGLREAPEGFHTFHPVTIDKMLDEIGTLDLLLTADTGPMHIAAAMGVPVIAIHQASSPDLHLSDQRDFISISPSGLDCLNCQDLLCRINSSEPPCQNISPEIIIHAAQRWLEIVKDYVSAVVAIYKPTAERLNRCLEAVLPQVNEVVVVSDTAGVVPSGAMTHNKIRYLQKPAFNVGYGRKANYGARHTVGKFILFLNDDCFVEPDVVAKLIRVMENDPKCGLVGHQLRYLDGTIQHGGTFRARDGVGFGHIDLGKREGRLKELTEVENVTGASILVRRSAHFDIKGFNEEIFLYCEDNFYCMALRQKGWKIFYEPRACAIHEEHCSTSITPGGLYEVMMDSQKLFHRKWAWYFEKNKNNEGLGVF